MKSKTFFLMSASLLACALCMTPPTQAATEISISQGGGNYNTPVIHIQQNANLDSDLLNQGISRATLEALANYYVRTHLQNQDPYNNLLYYCHNNQAYTQYVNIPYDQLNLILSNYQRDQIFQLDNAGNLVQVLGTPVYYSQGGYYQ